MASETPVRVLLLEDSAVDAELVAAHLRKAELEAEITCVATQADFRAALKRDTHDVVLADYSLPDFDGLSALAIAQELRPHLPFVFVSGVVGEEFATNALKLGALDYVLKRNLSRVAPAVRRALDQARERGERRDALAALERSEMNARLAAEAAKLGLWEYAPESETLRWDDTARWIFGAGPQDELSLEFLRARCHEEDGAALFAALRAALEGQSGKTARVQQDIRITLPGGALRWVAVHGQALADTTRSLRLVGVVRDITEERHAQEIMRAEAQELERQVAIRTAERDRIWRLSDELFAVVDLGGRIRRANPAWESLLGYQEGRLDGCLLSLLLHPEDRDGLAEVLQELRDGRKPPRREDRFSHQNGGWRWISWGAVAEEGAVYLAGRDVTAEREARIALAERNAELAAQIEERQRVEETLRQMQRLEAVGQLTSGVAHDFNNLLTVILGNIGFAERRLKTAEDDKFLQRLQTMRSAAERGASLTAQLLAFSRRQRLEPKAVDLNETVQGMRELLQSTMGGSIRIETNLRADLWSALVDPTQIELIILNLAINARDAIEVGGTLTLETANVSRTGPRQRPEEPPPGDYVMLSVRDTGTGMSPEVLAKAFEPFFTTKEVGKGSGLGLAQVYGFAAQSGGGVNIETRIGVGTTISVFLPRTQTAQEAGPDAAAHAPVPAAQAGQTVLVVDDDPQVREVTSTVLGEAGYRLTEAASGAEALAILRTKQRVDLLVADFAMPGMSGVELAREGQALRPGLKVLFVTGYVDLTSLDGVGEAQIIRKPFQEEELRAKVSELLRASPPGNVLRFTRSG
ncbi:MULTISPECIES: response regulator [unclassified Acidocella]|uniref:response regulator n=1 Tax=unclassified Acidocella TaxID=2648610 RepID=UPI00028CCB12|nr:MULTISPECIES: response regulator [unclassified Acidocella]EKM99456.1 sensor histidine kinase/response regulator [Acidocella sp. MX-AZ02]WBO58106.1 response regulator [Acidocella sp. MX-AZ03]